MPFSNRTSILLRAAEQYLTLGWSVIPLYGDADPGRPKVSTVAWAQFQQRRANPDEIHSWFAERRSAGLGIVTGAISGLVMLDFDRTGLFETFLRQHPDLARTHAVKTRRGCHLYFRLPAHLTLPSRKGQGVDLLSDGRYVVAPPSVINGHVYQVVHETEPHALTQDDITRIQAFLAAAPTMIPETAQKPHLAASMSVSDGTVETARATSSHLLTAHDLTALYQYLAPQHGRNEALFRASLRARDDGWSQQEVIAHLADVHVHQKPGAEHQSETDLQRRREAICTIRSAFSRPAHPRQPVEQQQQIPNSVRETLLQLKQTGTIRVIEGLRLAGILPGQSFTATQATTLLKGQVGRDSVYQALQATTPDGQRIFDDQNPSPSPLTPAQADTDTCQTQTKNCFFVSGQKSGKNRRGRPTCVFTMPGNLDLCRKLGVRPSLSDPLTDDDLRSAKTTRMALHRERIKRRPGLYSRRWLAEHLGVCIRTLHAYNREIPIQVRPMYIEIPITWATLKHIPAGFELAGTFLQDETGKRYPPRQEIAVKLLSQGRSVTYKRQDVNYYFYGDSPPEMSVTLGLRPDWELWQARQQQVQTFVRQYEHKAEKQFKVELSPPTQQVTAATACKETQPTSIQPAQASPSASPPEREQPASVKPISIRHYRQPLADERVERLAQQVQLRTSPNGLSIANARRLAETYGVRAVEAALKRMVWMQERKKITNAAGFMVIVSRVMWRQQNGATDLGAPAPRFKGESHRKRRS